MSNSQWHDDQALGERALIGMHREREDIEQENRELRELLAAAVKYAREDRAYTPGSTRLARLILRAARYLGIPDRCIVCEQDRPCACGPRCPKCRHRLHEHSVCTARSGGTAYACGCVGGVL